MKTKPTKRKPKAPVNQLQADCGQVCGTMNRRRSIPYKEVDEMLEQQAKSLRKEPTLYDQRAETLENIEHLSKLCEGMAENLNATQLSLASERNRLKDLNRLLKEELQFDQVR